ncbi:MAG: C-type lectin domain-containing protein [Oscillospiraceae bacterium]|nr:C-type lectin domain-containing protein [Oscillospiraceae bacterium]
MRKKQTAFLASLILLAQIGFCACQKDNSDSQKRSDSLMENSAQIETVLSTESPVILPDLSAEFSTWQEAYAVYIDYLIQKNPDPEFAKNNYRFALIQLDDDPEQIPELYFLSCSDAIGESVATWHEKHLVTLGLSNTSAADYIEKSNLLYHHPSKATNSPATVYALRNGVFEKIASGAYWWDSAKANNDKIEMDSRNRPANAYEWEGKSVSEQEFDQNLNAVYDTERSIRPQEWYPVDEILSVLETGMHTSVEHRYEFITADVSWTEAQASCREKGGYLAVITAPEERRTILEQLEEQNLTESLFFVGYQVNPERWILADQSEIPAGNLINFWEYQAPDYSFIEPEFETQECGILKYYPETDQIYLFAAPDELISTLPEYAGKIGYVCEYDN